MKHQENNVCMLELQIIIDYENKTYFKFTSITLIKFVHKRKANWHIAHPKCRRTISQMVKRFD